VGVIGYLMLTGTLPFISFRDKMFNPPPPMRDRRPDVPVALEAALAHALAADPGQRYASAADLREALVSALGSRKTPGAVPVAPPAVTSLGNQPIAVLDQSGTRLAVCPHALVVPGGAWLCTHGALPKCDTQVLLSVPGYEGFIQARVVSTALFPEHVRKALPRGFLVEFSRLETGAKAALAAMAPK
jgi:serine/threonine-protein kinase